MYGFDSSPPQTNPFPYPFPFPLNCTKHISITMNKKDMLKTYQALFCCVEYLHRCDLQRKESTIRCQLLQPVSHQNNKTPRATTI